ncbi:hypothetical protein [Lacrimispora defluvii]|uniref:Uncharacterized protein n=1 Tax=Lacrimispora defluvii TaxID=2719233 RepID=A0ABX1VQI6_9FIRM|nr:hypothetical protein [Lacrimispora defluvii]NNJ30079.1 hypothetical protein [Lacrimispora defluvii]
MSNVYTRNRKKTPFDVATNAEKLQDLVTLYVMDEKRVPKKWRYMIGQDLIRKIDELNDNVIAANSIYAMNEEDLSKRKEYAQRAISNGYQLQRKLSRLVRCVPSATPASLYEITALLSQEIDDMKGWRKNDKIRGK